ncbi:hypothetical protein B7P02_02345 [Bordetella bronchiseptica]|nr:hypothetical protein BTL45_02345 [Bordetella bronchiseptica]AWP56899.1 hypothetical protein B7P02_02345 [Bordetella bronchiseptica]
MGKEKSRPLPNINLKLLHTFMLVAEHCSDGSAKRRGEKGCDIQYPQPRQGLGRVGGFFEICCHCWLLVERLHLLSLSQASGLPRT